MAIGIPHGRDVTHHCVSSTALRLASSDHPAVATLLNNLADLYRAQGRHADALPLVQTTIGRGRAVPPVALRGHFAAQNNGLVSAAKAPDDALDVVQRTAQSATAAAVNKFAARGGAGSDRLAGLVRNDQDLAAETVALDKTILAAVSKEPAKRDAAAAQRIRDRLADITKQRASLQGVFAAEFPDYAALSNPQPLTVKEIQALLSDNEGTRWPAGDPGGRPLVGFADPVFDPAERARALAERRAAGTRVAVTRSYREFWQGAGIDPAKLAAGGCGGQARAQCVCVNRFPTAMPAVPLISQLPLR
jgi:Tetratricopeptide repeat